MATPQHKYPIVKYAMPHAGEEELRFFLKEDLGNRVLIELIDSSFAIKPVECVAKSEITIAY